MTITIVLENVLTIVPRMMYSMKVDQTVMQLRLELASVLAILGVRIR